MPDGLSVQCLGASACTPEKGENTASFVVDGRVAVDTGWYLTDRLLACDIDPLAVEAVLFTHCHHDHILGLPQLLFYWGISHDRRPERPLHIYGPAGEIERVVADGQRYLQFDRYEGLRYDVVVHGLRGGDTLDVAGLMVRTCSARHSVPGLCYRIERDGASVVFSGDTAWNPDLIDLARGANLLVHEASYGAKSVREDETWGHSGSPDAAEVARQAGVGRLALVHCGAAARADALRAARAIFPETELASHGIDSPRRGR
ncbi:MBL fold metallo-hydrolase [bacterium]|nr:MBL fold metallo-hydrolase [bacterium]